MDNSVQPFSEGRSSEVDKEADRQVQQAQVGEDLLSVHGCHALNGLRLHHDLIRDEKIQAEGILEEQSVEFEVNGFLAFHDVSAASQFALQDRFVYGFQKTRTELTMYAERGIHYIAGNVVQILHSPALPACLARRTGAP